MKVVESGYKIDLHIHSICSQAKDKGKVAFNTVDNIGVLAERLNNNGVQLCAITDHDAFGFDMYKALKAFEADDESSIIKVFPGVEFSVEFSGDNGSSVLHVIAIFNDDDDEKIRRISDCLTDKAGNICYDKTSAFSEEKFISILRNINLDTVLIVHQKSTLTAAHAYKNDAKSVGEEKFQEFVYTDYFEAYEFKNRKNEVFNKNFLNARNMEEDIRFITGSDCHDWRFYPKETEKDTTDFIYTYVKCLPCFRGLVMAITDHRRIKTVNSFFNPTETYTKSLQISINEEEYSIPLSRGINVIIGDNSIGKSLLLHKLTEYRKQQDGGLLGNRVVKGYEKYLKKHRIEVQTIIPAAEVFAFDMQGEIRDKFEQEKIKSDDFLKAYYPAPIKPEAYREKIQRKLNVIFDYLDKKYVIENLEAQLGRFRVIDEDIDQAESITFVGTVKKDNRRVAGYKEISEDLEGIIEKIGTVMDNGWLASDDKIELEYIIEQLDGLSKRYTKKKKVAERENTKIALFQDAISKFKQKYKSSVSDTQKKLSAYNESIDSVAEAIADILRRKQQIVAPDFRIVKEVIRIQTERVHDYEFNSRLGITEIDEEYIKNLFAAELNKGKKQILKLSQEELAEGLSRYTGTPSDALEELKNRIQIRLDDDLANKFTITQAGKDRTQELSSGFNSQIYFDILSYETSHDGIYIIDQPEDNISQKAIREYLLDRFKVMGEHRQVLIVTHNPQFIVNLDVDNVIFMGKDGDKLYIQSGALEYKDNEYNILDIISNHIEGGLDTLKRRWKRYEKNASV